MTTEKDIMVYRMHPENIPANWPYMRGFLRDALEKQGTIHRQPLDFILLGLMTGETVGWIITNNDKPVCAMVTKIDHYPMGTAVFVFLLGGEDWALWGDELDEALMKYAKEVDAKWVDTKCRKAIGKILSTGYGYEYKFETFVKELT